MPIVPDAMRELIMNRTSSPCAGRSIPDNYERYLVPLLFQDQPPGW